MSTIRRLTTADVDACVALGHARGWRTPASQWRLFLEVGEAFGLERAGHLVGTVVLNRFGGALASIAMTLVAPDAGRQGIGRALMEHALALAGPAVVFLYATPMGFPLYERLGFVSVGASGRFVGRIAPAARPLPPSVRAFRPADLAVVAALDEEANGAPRAPLLGAMIQRAERAVVVEREGRLSGFGLSTILVGENLLGPIIARADEDARAIADALVAGWRGIVRVDGAGDQAMADWAGAVGLSPLGESPLMIRGARVLPGNRALVRALAGRGFG